MPRVVVQLDLASSVAQLRLGTGSVSLFGAWIAERIASLAIDWPGVAFHRIDLTARGVQLTLIPRVGMSPVAVGLAIARAIRTETQAAALSCCGLKAGRNLWDSQTVVIVQSSDPGGGGVVFSTSAPGPAARSRSGGRRYSSTMRRGSDG